MGLLLVLYGAISLWMDKTSPAPAGLARLDSPASIDAVPRLTVARAQAELAQTPASAYRWADLAEANVNANKVDGGKFCMRQALAAAPGNPAILFRAANLYLRLEEYPETLRALTAVLRNPDLADYYDQVFLLYSQMDMPLEDLLKQGLPQTPAAANSFLRFWINQGKLDEAEETWKWISGNSMTSLQSAGSYVELLSKASHWDEAQQSWAGYTARLDAGYGKTNWVYNGSFEMKPVDCPFDWHIQAVDNVAVERDSDVSYQGGVSLRLNFSGTPAPTAIAYQEVLLEPGIWEVTARMKTRRLTSDQGVVIRMVDLHNLAKVDLYTNSIQGTENWVAVSRQFEVKTDSRLMRVEVMRPASREFDSGLKGIVWIDSVELRPVGNSVSIKAAGLADAGQPCKSEGDCGHGEAGIETTPK